MVSREEREGPRRKKILGAQAPFGRGLIHQTRPVKGLINQAPTDKSSPYGIKNRIVNCQLSIINC